MVYDVVVIGAGISGLAAARVCAEAGLRVVVLESSGRVGGRIRTERVGAEVIELGAEFVHGQPPELLALIAEAGLMTYERTGDFLVRTDEGFEVQEDEDDGVLEGLKEYAGEDCDFASYAAGLGLGEEELAAEIGYVEGFNAADAKEASVIALGRQQVAEDAIDGGRSWRVVEGYDRVPEYVAERVIKAGGEVVFGAWVVEVRGGSVVCADGREFAGERVVVALPLGVMLGAGRPRFEPEPVEVLAAMGRMRMGDACRETIILKERKWPEGMSFLLTPETTPRVWWTAHPAESLTLTGWVGGPGASESLGSTAAVARQVLGFEQEAVASVHRHDWLADELSCGAYSWVPVGGIGASEAMSLPVDGWLYFAGEHTDVTGHWGTVHGALRSGLRAGVQVVEASRVP